MRMREGGKEGGWLWSVQAWGGMKRKGAGHIDRERDERKQENKNARSLRIPFCLMPKRTWSYFYGNWGGGEWRIIIGMKG